MMQKSEHRTAEAEGYYYSDHYTPEELLDTLVRAVDERITLDPEPRSYVYNAGKRFKVTITVERSD